MRNEHPKATVKFYPSTTRIIRFSDGKELALNRKQRRKAKLYNKDLKRVKE